MAPTTSWPITTSPSPRIASGNMKDTGKTVIGTIGSAQKPC
jgi:hypothetical protein